ncbi:uncharacterized protein N7529_007771 [Penicillium soppii]|uniref:uncharacterized protein n=1 Tax=Penicillium soppii TaxID=69789 RepID=UPI002548ED35|nr:uncharacterized protein N7529_007771 [Penicillium soppii]KAJ5860461.1 hypothetical protein N7529_007771 [Penicillium soppii]
MTRHCSLIEEVALCVPTVLSDIHVGYSPDKGNIHKIPFLIPIPAGIPETTVTDLGQLSLYLVASTTTAAEEAIGASEQINIVRRIIPGSDPIQHTRIYPTSKVINDVILTQKLGASTGSRLSLSVRVSLRKPAAPSNRALEFKCVAIRKIQWRVEEVTKLFKSAKDYRQPRNEEPPEYEPVEDESFTRELFHGYQNGYWGTPDNPIVKEQETHQEKNSAVEIAFDIAIPRAVAPTPEIGLKCYSFDYRPGDHLLPCVHEDTSSMTQQRMMITVEHRLKLDILTSEDTFGVHNKSLVDRKPLQTALSGSFPLHILKKSQNNIDPDVWQVNPPCYTEIPASPPHYEPIF